MANANGWGDGASNNTIGWGQGANNAIGWGDIHADSWAGLTDIVGITTDPDAQAFITAAAITDPTQQAAINTLVVDLKGYSIWTKMQAVYPFVGGSATTHKFNLKDPRDLDAAYRLVFNGGWTHSVNGALPNGTNGYANTYFNISTLNINNNSMGFYSRTNIIAQQTDMGRSNVHDMGANFAGFGAFARNFNTSFGGFTNSNTTGFYINSRILSTENKLYKNSSVLGTISSTSSSSSGIIGIGASFDSGSGTIAYPSSKEQAFAFIGEGLNATEASNFYTAVQAFQTSLNRNI